MLQILHVLAARALALLMYIVKAFKNVCSLKIMNFLFGRLYGKKVENQDCLQYMNGIALINILLRACP